MRRFAALSLILAIELAGAAAAFGQAIGPNGFPSGPLGPPIDPQQVFRAQPQPMTTAPSPSVMQPAGPANPPLGAGPSMPLSAAPTAHIEYRDRVARCHHEAAVEQVPRRKRASYIHNCALSSD